MALRVAAAEDVSLASTPGASILSGVSSAVVKLSLLATGGGGLEGVTVSATVAGVLVARPLPTLNWKLSRPEKLVFGV
jgi:hypothetical protein